MMNQNF